MAPRSGQTPRWRIVSEPPTDPRWLSTTAASASASDSGLGIPYRVTTSRGGRSESSGDGTELTCASNSECSGLSSSITRMSMTPPGKKTTRSSFSRAAFDRERAGDDRSVRCCSVRIVGHDLRCKVPRNGRTLPTARALWLLTRRTPCPSPPGGKSHTDDERDRQDHVNEDSLGGWQRRDRAADRRRHDGRDDEGEQPDEDRRDRWIRTTVALPQRSKHDTPDRNPRGVDHQSPGCRRNARYAGREQVATRGEELDDATPTLREHPHRASRPGHRYAGDTYSEAGNGSRHGHKANSRHSPAQEVHSSRARPTV